MSLLKEDPRPPSPASWMRKLRRKKKRQELRQKVEASQERQRLLAERQAYRDGAAQLIIVDECHK
ncbi:hypothetical protein PoHVEF18_010387 [Penicillium ochrochloron]